MERATNPAPSSAWSQRSAVLQMTQLLDMTSDAVMVRDLEGTVTYWNRAAERHYGWTPQEAIGRPACLLLDTAFPADLELLEAELRQTGRWEGMLIHQRRDGSHVTVESHWEVFVDELGNPAAILQVDHPVPNRETGIDPGYAAQRTELLEDLVQNLPATFVFLDKGWVYRLVTHQSAAMMGRTLDDMLGRHFLDVFPDSRERMESIHQRVCVEGQTVTQTAAHAVIPTPDGQWRDTYWDFTMRPVYDRHGALLGLTSMGFEVSERVELEREVAQRSEALEKANRALMAADRYKDEFLSVISHELKTPLNFIMAFASILADEVNGPLNADQHLEVQRIQEGSERLLALVNDLLDAGELAANRVTLTLSETGFADLVAEVVATHRPLAEKRSQCLETEVLAATPLLMDRHRIRQVLNSLLDNAVKFTPEGGQIHVRVSPADEGVRVEVSDTGPGIAPEDVGKVFAPFLQLDMSHTRRVGGTGIGLCLAKALVEAHHGRIGIDSTPGEGCRFWFELPLAGP